MFRTIASIVSDEQAVQDVAQETFLSAWNNLAKLKERRKFGTWVNQTAINLSKRWLRDQRKYYENTASFQDVVLAAQAGRHQREKFRQDVWEGIDELSEDHREAVILYYISGYSYKEISGMLSVPVSTIRGRLQKARNQLRKEFLDMVSKLQLEIDSTVHRFLKEHAQRDGLSIEGLILRLIEIYRRDIDKPEVAVRQIWEASREPVLSDFCGAPLADGKPQGEPQLIKRDTGQMRPMGFTREGSLYYGLGTASTDIYAASIDPTTGEILGPTDTSLAKKGGTAFSVELVLQGEPYYGTASLPGLDVNFGELDPPITVGDTVLDRGAMMVQSKAGKITGVILHFVGTNGFGYFTDCDPDTNQWQSIPVNVDYEQEGNPAAGFTIHPVIESPVSVCGHPGNRGRKGGNDVIGTMDTGDIGDSIFTPME